MIESNSIFLLRTPIFCAENLFALYKLFHQEEVNEMKLRKFFSDPLFKEGIFCASSDTYLIFEKWMEMKPLDKKKKDKLLRTLFIYYTRMSFRSTPFGFFAGFSFGTVKNSPSSICFDKNKIKIHQRPDMEFTEALKYHVVTPDYIVANDIKLFKNNTIYKSGRKYRYVKKVYEDNRLSYRLSSFDSSPILDYLLTQTINGAHLSTLVDSLSQVVDGFGKKQLEQYVLSLYKEDILDDDILPKITNIDYDIFKSHKSIFNLKHPDLHLLKEYFIQSYSFKNLQKITDSYRKLFPKITNCIQVDAEINSVENNLNKKIIDEIVQQIIKISELSKVNTSTELKAFKNEFLLKYDGKEIPLTEALDFDIGIGYGYQKSGLVEEAPLLNGVRIPEPGKRNIIKHSKNEFTYILRKLLERQQDKSAPIQITDEDIEAIKEQKQESLKVDDFFVIGTIISNSIGDIDNGKYNFLVKGALPSPYGKNLISRFAYYAPKLNFKQGAIDNDTIYAEVVCNTGGKVGNILQRSKFYDYEIPYLSKSSSNDKQIIPIDDLLISVINGKVILRSKKNGKIVKPRLSSSHNFSLEGLHVLRFLCDLQYEDVDLGYSWEWDEFEEVNFLPRVEYKKIILYPARWKIDKISNLALSEFKMEISKLGVPRYCFIMQSDMEQFIDTENHMSLTILYEFAKKSKLLLAECIGFPDKQYVQDGHSFYNSEIVLPLNQKNFKEQSPALPFIPKKQIKRIFLPGEEWLYFKIFCSNNSSDVLLTGFISDFIKKKTQQKKIESWFFIRYGPPNHIRLRLKLCAPYDMEIISELSKVCALSKSNLLVEKIELGTYKRELERYGYNKIIYAEQIFHHDSFAVLKSLKVVRNGHDEQRRWMVGVLSIDRLLEDFGLSLVERREIMFEISADYMDEFTSQASEQRRKQLKIALDTKYRSVNKEIEELINRSFTNSDLQKIQKFMIERSSLNAEPIAVIKSSRTIDKNTLKEMILSFVHMTMIRIIHTRVRKQELVLYYILFKAYDRIIKKQITSDDI